MIDRTVPIRIGGIADRIDKIVRVGWLTGITGKLQEITHESGEPVFDYIDMDRKQIQNPGFPQTLIPIALVNFLDTPWQNSTGDYQVADLVFAVDTYFDGWGETF